MAQQARLERRRSAVREVILDGAREAIDQLGYQAFSMRRLAEKIGYSPGALYLYFKTREELLNCLVDEAFDKLLEVVDQVHDSKDAVRSLKNKLRAYVEFGLRFPQHYQLAFLTPPTGERAAPRRPPHASFDLLRDAVRRCKEEERVPWPDVETTSQILWVTIHGITSLLIVRPNFPWVEREGLIDQVLDTAIRGLEPSSADQSGGDDDSQ